MANIIKLKQSSVAGKVPISGDLVQGELAVNTNDEKLYMKNSSGTIVEISGGSYDSSTTAPSSPDNGDHWFDPDTGILYVRVASTWLDIATAGGAPTNVFTNSTTAPATPIIGDTWYDPSTLVMATRAKGTNDVPFWWSHTPLGSPPNVVFTSPTNVLDVGTSALQSYAYDVSEIYDGGDAASTYTTKLNGGTA
jgi:hypothetical protein